MLQSDPLAATTRAEVAAVRDAIREEVSPPGQHADRPLHHQHRWTTAGPVPAKGNKKGRKGGQNKGRADEDGRLETLDAPDGEEEEEEQAAPADKGPGGHKRWLDLSAADKEQYLKMYDGTCCFLRGGGGGGVNPGQAAAAWGVVCCAEGGERRESSPRGLGARVLLV